MIQATEQILIGVDGGGTNCRFAALGTNGRTEVSCTTANVSTDFDGAIATLREGLAQLARDAGLSEAALADTPAHIGLAGVMNPEQAKRIAKALPLRRATVSDDRLCAVLGALGEADGAVAGLGTGSYLARQTGGSMRYAGGWGLRLDDRASGAWLGREILARTLHAEDGLTDPSDLTRVVNDEFDGPAGIVAFSVTATPAAYAVLAPRVCDAADAGDSNAAALMAMGAEYVEAALNALGWSADETLCLIGGVGPRFAPYLSPALSNALAPPLGNALDGALHLAARNNAGGAQG